MIRVEQLPIQTAKQTRRRRLVVNIVRARVIAGDDHRWSAEVVVVVVVVVQLQKRTSAMLFTHIRFARGRS